MTTISTDRSGYADVNGLHMYYELHGEGSPLMLIHGGMLTIDINFAGLISTLAQRHLLVAVELQGHGRTADIDREITPANSASDLVSLLDHLGIDRAHVLGHSMGAAVALEMAISHPSRVRAVVPVSGSVRPDGMHSDLSDPSTFQTSTRMPTPADFAEFAAAYQRLSPHPERFQEFLGKMSASAADLQGWPDKQLAAITAPVLIVVGDHDFVTIEHAALMMELIPGSQLAVLPGTTHMQATHRPELLLPMLTAFLD